MKQPYKLYPTPLYTTFRELIEDISKKYGEKTAYSFRRDPKDGEVQYVSFAQLAQDVRSLVTALHARKLEGTHVALIGKLSYPWVLTYLSLFCAGAVIVPLDADWTEEDLADTVKRADCVGAFYSKEIGEEKIKVIRKNRKISFFSELDSEEGFWSLIREGEEGREAGDRTYETTRLSPDELAMLAFTSGTTGKGKGVMLTQTAILTNITNGLRFLQLTPKAIAVLPPHHTFGCNLNLLAHLIVGADMYLSSGVRYLLKEFQEHKPGHLALVPLFLESFRKRILDGIRNKGIEKDFWRMVKISNSMRKRGIDMRRKFFKGILDTFGGEIRLAVCGGAPLAPDLVDFFDAIGIKVINAYGITECSPGLAINPIDAPRKGSVGIPLLNETVKIREADENGEGEICIKGSNVMLGYYKDPEATEAAFDEDGYFRTGDIGKLDADGYLYITGRAKNLIILSNGKNVYPEEIEAAFATVEGIEEIVVYEGISARGTESNLVVAEIYPNEDFIRTRKIENAYDYFYPYVQDYNRVAVPYKKIGLLKIRNEEFPKNTLRKIVRFKIDKNID